jgi:hypothetical protein
VRVNWCASCGGGRNFGDQLGPILLRHYGELAYDESVAERETARAPGAAAFSGFECGHEIRPRRLPRGRETKDDAGDQREPERPGQHACVRREVERQRHLDARRRRRTQQTGGPERQHGRQPTAEQRSIVISVSCRATRHRLAPIASRTAISRLHRGSRGIRFGDVPHDEPDQRGGERDAYPRTWPMNSWCQLRLRHDRQPQRRPGRGLPARPALCGHRRRLFASPASRDGLHWGVPEAG